MELNLDVLTEVNVFLPLGDVFNMMLITNNNQVNWKEYFMYHTGVNEELLDNFGTIIDSTFMKEHGRYLVTKPLAIIKKYLKVWDVLVSYDINTLFDKKYEYTDEVFCVDFGVKQTSDVDHHTTVYQINKYNYDKYHCTLLDLEGDIISEREFLSTSTYEEIKLLLSSNEFTEIRVWCEGTLIHKLDLQE